MAEQELPVMAHPASPPTGPKAWKKALWFFALLAPAAALMIDNQDYFRGYLCDDALISFRYARNLVNGNGLVFNLGGYVEGYSNFLWTLIIAGTMAIFSNPFGAVKLIGLAAFGGSIFYAGLIVRSLSREKTFGVVAVGCVMALNTGLGCYSASGLETVAFGFFVTAGAYHGMRRTSGAVHFPLAMFWFTCAALTRPEGVMFIVYGLGFRLGEWVLKGERPDRREWLCMTLATLAFAGYETFRIGYYQDVLPNTFYAKPHDWMEGNKALFGGLEYFHDYARKNGGYLLLLFSLVYWARTRGSREMTYLLGVWCGGLVFVIYANADWMIHWRFLAPYTGLLMAMGFAGLFDLTDGIGKWTPAMTALALVLITFATQSPMAREFQTRKEYYPYLLMNTESLGQIGKNLAERFGPETTLATKRIGAVGYYSNLRIEDTLGLVDKRIARLYHTLGKNKLRREAMVRDVLDRKPDLLLVYTNHHPKNPKHTTLQEAAEFSSPDSDLLGQAIEEGYRYVDRFRTGVREKGYLFRRPDFVLPK